LRSVRFEQPYVHMLRVPGEAADRTLSIQQAPFNAEGFASTGGFYAGSLMVNSQVSVHCNLHFGMTASF
jgi:hypothetical protein